MTHLAEIQAHIASMGELREIIGAMRSLAGMRVQEAQRTLPGISRYAETIASALAASVLLLREAEPPRPAKHGKSALILFMAEHGFTGAFNERLLHAAEERLEGGCLLFVLGRRGYALAIERGKTVSSALSMASRCAAAPETVRHLSAGLYARLAQGEIARVEVIYARHHPGGAPEIKQRLLLPLDLGQLRSRQARQEPLHNLTPGALYEKLAAEYVYSLLTEAAVESIASENAARLAAMESAHDNVTRKLETLRLAEREARQSEITSELLDLIIGAEAQRHK